MVEPLEPHDAYAFFPAQAHRLQIIIPWMRTIETTILPEFARTFDAPCNHLLFLV